MGFPRHSGHRELPLGSGVGEGNPICIPLRDPTEGLHGPRVKEGAENRHGDVLGGSAGPSCIQGQEDDIHLCRQAFPGWAEYRQDDSSRGRRHPARRPVLMGSIFHD